MQQQQQLTTMAEWWDDDPELLSATLSMLAEWDCKSQARGPESLSSVSTSSVSSGSPRSSFDGTGDAFGADAMPVVIGPMRNLSRERRKEEAEQLRAEIWRLEGQLRKLGVGKHSTRTADLFVWRNMADGQLQARRQAEQVNAQLRRMTIEQARVAEELIALIHKAEHARRRGFPIPGVFTVEIPREMVQRVTREHQFQRLDMLCVHWREAFMLCSKFQTDARPFLDLRVVQRDDQSAIIDLYASSAVPFSVSRVKQVMWQHFLEPRPEGGGQTFAQTSEAFDDRVAADYAITNTHGRSHGRYVTRRLVNDVGHPMFITHSHSESDRANVKASAFCVMLDQDSWVRLVDGRELHGGISTSTSPMTMLQNVRRVRVTVMDGFRPPQSQEITKFVLQVLEVETMWAHQSIHNLLMQPRAIVDVS